MCVAICCYIYISKNKARESRNQAAQQTGLGVPPGAYVVYQGAAPGGATGAYDNHALEKTGNITRMYLLNMLCGFDYDICYFKENIRDQYLQNNIIK